MSSWGGGVRMYFGRKRDSTSRENQSCGELGARDFESNAARKTGSIIVVCIMTAVAFAGFAQAPGDPELWLSDRIVFFDDFEDSGSGGFDWFVVEGPPPNEFGPEFGYNAEGQFDLPGDWGVHMYGDQTTPGEASAWSQPYFLEEGANYIITFDLMLPQPSYPGPYEGWFTVVDDGNVWMIFDGEYDSEHWSLTTFGRKGQVLPPFDPLLYDKWYHVECRVHFLSEEYDIYVNGNYVGTQGFDRGMGNMAFGHLVIGDTDPVDPDAYGEAFWDNILVSHLADSPWSDQIDDDIDDWTRIVTPGNYFGPWPNIAGRSDVIRMFYQGIDPQMPPEEARGFSPFFDVLPEEGYVLSFWFFVEGIFTNSEFTVVDDGRIWLKVEEDAGEFNLVGYMSDDNIRTISSIQPFTWYNIVCRVDIGKGLYHVYLDGSYADTSAFAEFENSYSVRPMTPNSIFLGGRGHDVSEIAEAYWDEFIFLSDSDGDGLTDIEEDQGTYGWQTDPLDWDSDDDYLLDSTEVGLGGYDQDPSSTTNPHDQDSDDDGIIDGNEDWNKDGAWNEGRGLTESSPNHWDSDGDGLSDGQEIGLQVPQSSTDTDPFKFEKDEDNGETTTDPMDEDSDDDGLPDGWIDGWVDGGTPGFPDYGEFEDLDLNGEIEIGDYGQTSGSGETDPNDDDTDDDGLQDFEEACGGSGCGASYNSNPLLPDTDSDGMPDEWEVVMGTLVRTPDEQANYDGDTLSNELELAENSDPLNGDTDFDLISDSDDVNILDFNIKNELGNIFENIDVSGRFEFEINGFTFYAAYAVDYVKPSKEEVRVSQSSILDGNLNSVITKLHFETDYQLTYDAVLKIGWEDEAALGDSREQHLLMYYYIGDDGVNHPHWTLAIRQILGESTGREPSSNCVWVRTRQLGDFAVADTTQNNLDPLEDSTSDGEEINVAEYDPDVIVLCDSEDDSNCKTQWVGVDALDLGEGGANGDITMYLPIEVVEGAYENVLEDTPYFWINGDYGDFRTVFAERDFPQDIGRPIYSSFYRAQSFTPLEDLDFASLDLYVTHVLLTDENADIRVYLDDEGEPPDLVSGSPPEPVVSVELDPDDVDLNDWTKIEFSSPVSLIKDQVYWIVMSCDDCTDHAHGYTWWVSISRYYEKSARSDDSGSTWTIFDGDPDQDQLFQAWRAYLPTEPKINVRSAEGDPTWNYIMCADGAGCTLDETSVLINDMVTNPKISDDMNTFIGAWQSFCDESGCVNYEQTIYIPIVFHSFSAGKIEITQVFVPVVAVTSDPLEQDSDGDGIPDAVEDFYYCTSPGDPDSDGDELWDGEEIRVYGTDPCDPNPDGDGGNDKVEVQQWFTDPWLADTDNDLLLDHEEIAAGSNPFDPDTDRDGWIDGEDSAPLDRSPFEYWGFTWHWPSAWIKTECNVGGCVDPRWQVMWDDYVAVTHTRVIRMDIDVMESVERDQSNQLIITSEGAVAIKKWTNLAIWAKENDAYLMPILGGVWDWCVYFSLDTYGWVPDPFCQKDELYIERSRFFVKGLAGSILSKDPEAYGRIIAYQVENEMNMDLSTSSFYSPWPDMGGMHDFWTEDREIKLLGEGSKAIRDGENDANVPQDLQASIMMNFAYGWWIWTMGLGSPYLAYPFVALYIQRVLTEYPDNEIDVIGLDYYPMTWSIGTPVDLVLVVSLLAQHFSQDIIVAETGLSTHYVGAEDVQLAYYGLTTELLKDYYHNLGGEADGFKGVMWYEFDSDEEPPEDIETHFGIVVEKDNWVDRTKPVWTWLKDGLQP
jgi:hypothetical protein